MTGTTEMMGLTAELAEVFTHAVGRTLYLRPGTSDQRAWADCYSGGYTTPPADFPTPRNVLDIGANCGFVAALYAHLWPDARIVAVEMDADNCAMIRLNAPTVEVVNCAVVGDARPPFWRYQKAGIEAEAYAVGGIEGGDTIVALRRLESIIRREFGRETVDFVKCDAESAEWGILEHGAQWQHLVGALLIELHAHGAPFPPAEPWPEGRDGPNALLAAAVPMLERLGYTATPRTDHPASVWATREITPA